MKNAMKQILLWALVMATASLVLSAQTPETPPAQSSPSQTAPGQTPPNQTPPSQTPPTQTPAPQPAPPQTPLPLNPYKPKFLGDPARSDSEAQALGYMRVVLRAEQIYKKRHDKYADSLAELAGTGSFTKRMARSTERGDYTVGFRPRKDGFILTMTPKQLDAEHRSFYAEEDSIIHADDQKAADASSPRIK